MTRLDGVSPLLRWCLVGGTAILLGGATLGLGRTPWGPWQIDLVVALILVLVIATWLAILGRVPPPTPSDHPERLRALAVAAFEVRGGAWNDRLAARDLAFSVPVLIRALRALAGPGSWGAPVVERLDEGSGELVLGVVVPGPEPVRLRVTRPLGVPFPPPGGAPAAVAGAEPGALHPVVDGWRLEAREPAPGWVAPPPAEDPGMPAARRALLARDPTFGPEEFDGYVRMVRTRLGDDPDLLEPAARADLAFLGGPPEVPIDAVRWLEVEIDGWHERLEVVCGALWLSFARPIGRPDAPWTVWRLQRGAP